MRLTTKGRFAVIAMVDLALNQGHASVSLASISDRQSISLSYLEQLFGRLRKNGLVESRRGPGGGYIVKPALDEVTIAQIIKAVDEPMDTTQCGTGRCVQSHQKGMCLTHKLWENLNGKILDYLSSVTLQNLIEQNHSVLDGAQSEAMASLEPMIQKKNILPKRASTKIDKPRPINSIFNLGQVTLGEHCE